MSSQTNNFIMANREEYLLNLFSQNRNNEELIDVNAALDVPLI